MTELIHLSLIRSQNQNLFRECHKKECYRKSYWNLRTLMVELTFFSSLFIQQLSHAPNEMKREQRSGEKWQFWKRLCDFKLSSFHFHPLKQIGNAGSRFFMNFCLCDTCFLICKSFQGYEVTGYILVTLAVSKEKSVPFFGRFHAVPTHNNDDK